MIVFSGSRLKATDSDGNTKSISVIDAEQDTLKVGDDEQREYLTKILKELKILNLQMSLITDNFIEHKDINEV